VSQAVLKGDAAGDDDDILRRVSAAAIDAAVVD
jgi:hypothetical protein